MEDVIFAGTAGRPPLGRAEVSLTIDNTDGALPIEYTEVTITRTMFRNGGSEYAINGKPCRLLDVQELLSDSGLGREMHVIVGQGQLDTVLHATPEERRGFIEEAAGVLKHRKRKEKTLRKLDAMQANLTRVQDLTGEIRRQLEAARPAGRGRPRARPSSRPTLRDARLRLLADDLVQLTGALEQEVADETALSERRTAVEDALADVRQRLADLERGPPRPRPSWPGRRSGSAPAEPARADGVDRLGWPPSGCACSPRTRSTRPPPAATPRSCGRQAAQVREEEAALLAEVGCHHAGAGRRGRRPRGGRGALRRGAGPAGPARPRRRRPPRGAGQARRPGRRPPQPDRGRGGRDRPAARSSSAAARARAAEAEQEFTRLEGGVAVEEEGEEGLDDAYERAAARLAEAEAEIERLVDPGARGRARPLLGRRPGSRPSSWACAARTARPPCSPPPTPTTPSSARSPPCCTSTGPRGRGRRRPGLGRRGGRRAERRPRRPRDRVAARPTTPGAPRCSSARTASPSDPATVAGARRLRRVGARRGARPRLGAPGRRAAARAGRAGAHRGPRGGPGLARRRASPPSRPTATSSARAGPAAAAAPARACSSCRPPSTRPRRRWMPRPPAPSGPGSRWARPASGPREVGVGGRGRPRGAARVRRPDGGRRRAARRPGRRGAPGVRRGRPHRAGHRRGAPRARARPHRARRAVGAAAPRPRRRPAEEGEDPPPTSATGSSWPRAGPAPPRPSCGWPCAPARSGPARSRAGPTRSRAPPATSWPPASGCASAGSAAAARPRWPPPCTRPRPTPSSASPPPCPARPRCATRPRPTDSSASRPGSPCAPS